MFKAAILILSLVTNGSRADWMFPFFTDVNSDIQLNLISHPFDQAEFLIDEEIQWPFDVAYFSYDGTLAQSPQFQEPFSLGSSDDLGLEFEQRGSRWVMKITQRQDYENVNNREYLFEMKIESVHVTITMRIRNIFDNKPTVTALENPCSVDELNEPNFTSDCLYNVIDRDGMTGNVIRFEIDGTSNEAELFGFEMVQGQSAEYFRYYALVLKKELHYDERSIYSFQVTVYDAADNSFDFNVILRVIDLPNLKPMWTKVFASAQFDEKQLEDLYFYTKAIDGDTGVNADICYRLEFDQGGDYSNLVKINDNGAITVRPIDRDAWKQEVFAFHIIAMECGDHNSNISSLCLLIVNDKNDNAPEIVFSDEKNVIRFFEQISYTLFSPDDLYVEDIDLGSNATYTVKLSPDNFAASFSIAPDNGYQKQMFSITVAQAEQLDYDRNEEFRNFSLTITAVEVDQTHSTSKSFQIELINWNDEQPYFVNDSFYFEVNETVASNHPIGTVEAKDDDYGDSLEYYLTGAINQTIAVNTISGILSTLVDNAFDYEQQTEVMFQVLARDTLQTEKNESTHTTFAQVHISVIDVNDTPPSISLPREILSVAENSDNSVIITSDIEITDPDTTASLTVSIDWSQSRAIGMNVIESDYEGCVVIEATEVNNNKLDVTLRANSSHLIDYEKFQLLYLTITAVDSATVVNANSTSITLSINIIDVNDNAPEFVGNTLEVRRSVIEQSKSAIFIGFINARDIDTPLNNFTYSLIANDTATEEWVKIDNTTGEISVDADNAINCDDPPRDSLVYTVRLHDGLFTTEGNISIEIIDINNQVPVPELPSIDKEIRIYENVSDCPLTTVYATDADRDAPHNVLRYLINVQVNPELQRYFELDSMTGELRVKLLDDFNRLDRDTEPSEYTIIINIEDNMGLGSRNTINTTVQIILLDVNDNAPQMPASLDISSSPIVETVTESTVLVSQLYAPDIDEGKNAQVVYHISSIAPIKTDSENPTGYESLFVLENYEDKYARILAGINLKGFSGKWSINIVAADKGDEGDSRHSMSSNETYEITIEPFNYNNPRIIFPQNNSVLRLDYSSVQFGSILTLLNTSKLLPFEAVDDDAGIYGDVTFTIDSLNGDHSRFEMHKLSRKLSDLRVINTVEEKVYAVSISAHDGGNSTSETLSLKLAFIDPNSQPYFNYNEWEVTFTENVTGLEELKIIPEGYAIDDKNIGVTNEEEYFQMFYYIDDTYNEESAKLFLLDSTTGELRLAEQLDREEVDHHTIRMIVSNSDAQPDLRDVLEKSFLIVEIKVADVNDNPPSFVYEQYSRGISENDKKGDKLYTLEATDPDLNDSIAYHLLHDTIEVSNDELTSIKNTAFLIDENTGALILNFEVTNSSTGFFQFKAEARDMVDHSDTMSIKIYIVSEQNRLSFEFENMTSELSNARHDVLITIFSEAYEAECVHEGFISKPNSDEKHSIMRAHFVNNSEALDKRFISSKSDDNSFTRKLQSRLRNELQLELVGFPVEEKKPDEPSRFLEIILLATIGILAVLLAVMTVFYILQLRRYKRQLRAEKKSEPNADSFYNVKAVPNTNCHSEEKQVNPAMMMTANDFNVNSNNVDLDTKSIISSDSDDFANLNDSNIFDIRKNTGTNGSTFA